MACRIHAERPGARRRLYDGWLPYPPDPADFASGLAAVRTAAADPAVITPALFATVLIDEDAERGRRGFEEYCLANYQAPLEYVEKIQVLITGSSGQVVTAELRRYLDAGARHVLVRLATVEPEAFGRQLEQVAAMIADATTAKATKVS